MISTTMEETTDNQSCFGVFHHETCKKISAQAQLICALHDRISVLESTAITRIIPNNDAHENEVRLLKEQFAQREQAREQQLDELTTLLLEQCAQKAEEDDELHAIVMEKHALLLNLGQKLTNQQIRIHELEIALSSTTTGEEKHHLLLSGSPEKASTSLVIDQQEVVDLQTALAEMQAKFHQAQEAAENRENFLSEQIHMLKSILQLPEEWEIQRDDNNRIFFYKNQTKECQWDLPTTTQESRNNLLTAGTEVDKTLVEKLQQQQQPLHENQRPSMTQPLLPENWIAMEDISSHTNYYYNKMTGLSQWELPVPPPTPVVNSIATLFRSNKNKR